MHGSSIFERFPEELRQHCLSYCNSSTIFNLCLASKAVYRVCVDSVFHTIDLSTHNSKELRRHNTYSNIRVPPDYVKALHDKKDVSLMARQLNLIDLMESKPELACKTRTLKWTCVVVNPWTTPRDEFNLGTYLLWNTFSRFNNLSELDIGFMTGIADLDAPTSWSLKHITSLSLSGTSSFKVLNAIFSSINHTHLRHLRLNNLQTFAEPSSAIRQPTNNNAHVQQTPTIYSSHRRERHGAAQGYLADLTDRCISLRSFHYLSTAEFFDGSSGSTREQALWTVQVQDEIKRHTELASFISSVKPTLREFLFEHGPDIDYYGTAFGQRFHNAFVNFPFQHPLPMDRFFDSYVLPVLTSGPWPLLKSMTVKGIGHWKPIDAWSDDATPDQIAWLHSKTAAFREKAMDIWDAVPEGCEVCIEAEASRPFYRFVADKAVTGKGDDIWG